MLSSQPLAALAAVPLVAALVSNCRSGDWHNDWMQDWCTKVDLVVVTDTMTGRSTVVHKAVPDSGV